MVIMCLYAMDRFYAGAYSGANHVSVFGDWLKAEREKRGWSQPQIADAAGTSTPTISRIETGARGPSRKLARSIAQALGADPREALEALMADTPGIAPLATLDEVQTPDTLLREFDLLTPEEQLVIAGVVTSLLRARGARS